MMLVVVVGHPRLKRSDAQFLGVEAEEEEEAER
jgi:hypothetical protein